LRTFLGATVLCLSEETLRTLGWILSYLMIGLAIFCLAWVIRRIRAAKALSGTPNSSPTKAQADREQSRLYAEAGFFLGLASLFIALGLSTIGILGKGT